MPCISIICPIYQSESYLSRCVDSILNQTFPDFELLLINDGSPDRSGALCDQYAAIDGRVRVFHKKNGGVSSARQVGIDNVAGEYTIQIDPDDWVEPTMLQDLYEKAKADNADVVMCDHYIDYGKYTRYKNNKPANLNHIRVVKDLFYIADGSLSNKLIKYSCYKNPKLLRFPVGMNQFEDLIMCIQILVNPVKVSYVNKAYLHYVQNVNANSMMRSSKRFFLTRERLCQVMESLLDRDVFEQELLYLRKIEAYTALCERTFSKREFMSRYADLPAININWYGDTVVNMSIKGYYHVCVIYLYFKINIKTLAKYFVS